MKSISYNSQKEDYKIVGDEVVLEDGYSFNYKDILEKNGFTTDTEGEEGEQ